jgi:SAM-dependent methyltransferase
MINENWKMVNAYPFTSSPLHLFTSSPFITSEVRPMLSQTVPLILTCDRNLEITEQFVASYRALQPKLRDPVVILDLSSSATISGGYLSLINSINPRVVHIHPREAGMSAYDSVQEAAFFALEKGLAETAEGEAILFLEDDIRFSPSFAVELDALQLANDVGLVALYTPGNGYATNPIDPNHFYGTQCVLFPRAVAKEIVTHREYIMKRFYPGYDIRWSRYLGERGYKLYATEKAYVQHLGEQSILHNGSSHTTNRFHDPYAEMTAIYDRAFFDMHTYWQQEYDVIAEDLDELLNFSSAIDLGCGNGFLLARLLQLGKTVRGVDGSQAALEALPEALRPLVTQQDLTLPFELGRFELVICSEVAEHLDARFADALVDNICAHASRWVYFTAAVPGQGGHQHVNEQPHTYWVEKFQARGFELDSQHTEILRNRFSEVIHTIWWFTQNSLVFRRS